MVGLQLDLMILNGLFQPKKFDVSNYIEAVLLIEPKQVSMPDHCFGWSWYTHGRSTLPNACRRSWLQCLARVTMATKCSCIKSSSWLSSLHCPQTHDFLFEMTLYVSLRQQFAQRISKQCKPFQIICLKLRHAIPVFWETAIDPAQLAA